jgi:hypothetical protein
VEYMLTQKQKYFFRLIFSVSVLLTFGATKAQQTVIVHASIDSTQILIGNQFHLQLNADVNPAYGNIVWNNVPDSFNHIEVVDRSKIDTANVNGLLHYHQQLTLTSFDSGRWTIPALPFTIIPANPEDTASLFATTDSLLINVNTVPVDTTKPFNPIKSIRAVKLSWLDYIGYILLGAGVVILILLIVYLIRKRRKRPASPLPPRPKETPYEAAIRALKKMEEDKIWQQTDIKTYYTQVTDVLREYLEKQFSIPAMELTTDELMQQIKPVTILSQQKDTLQKVLSEADLVKFAKMQPTQEEEYFCLRHVIDIVEWTKPKPKEAAEDQEKKAINNNSQEGTKP